MSSALVAVCVVVWTVLVILTSYSIWRADLLVCLLVDGAVFWALTKSSYSDMKIFLYLILIITLWTWMRSVSSSKIVNRGMAVTAVAAILLFLVVSGIVCGDWGRKIVTAAKRDVKEIISVCRYGRNHPDAACLMNVKVPVGTTLYLKSKIDTVYKNGCWSEVPDPIITRKYAGMDAYFHKYGFSPETQLSEYLEDSGVKGREKIEVTYSGLNREKLYIANHVTAESFQELAGDCFVDQIPTTSGLIGRDHFSYQVTECDILEMYRMNEPNPEPGADTESEAETESKSTGEGSEKAYRRCEMIYRNYVYDTCLQLPAEFEEHYPEEELAVLGGNTVAEAVESVRAYLQDVDEHVGKEEWVTHAVWLLRRCGIPTRYASGYYLHAPEDGSETASIAVDRTNRHVWAEIYLDGIGFVPFEVIPEYYAPDRETADAAATAQASVQKSGEPEMFSEGNVKSRNRRIIISGFIGIAVCMFFVDFCIQYFYRRRLYSENVIEFARFMDRSLENVLKCDKVSGDFQKMIHTEIWIREQFGTVAAEAFLRIREYLNCVQFNEKEPEYLRKETVREDLRRLYSVTSREMRIVRKVRMRFLGRVQ
ncbi:transglutaminase-like domain-containing protein [Hespellia stercorisuis]|uniref:Transglutaminase-like superfamily protein n=1 Tax=Hespellia stercorisuis DSM 15480 TaxID=1121950 RepID=A0A1M6M0Q1_9FIRM|nr:transglutaminase-like domain-containing protein [Hespellia stercorisuis]SHJ76920.1 Transglutaminase-like superfamily protein [Hespellia stercorisuis DSM 15480]